MPDTRTPEETVRAFFDIFNDRTPDLFDDVVGENYQDYGHDPAGVGPQGARDDYQGALDAGFEVTYTIDALVASGPNVAAAWTGRLPDGQAMTGLSLYATADGRLTETRHALWGPMPDLG